MRFSRRDALKVAVGGFISLAGKSDASSISEPQAANPLRKRMRIEEFEKHPDLVQALKRGVERMKALEPSNPHSWFYQGAIHGVSQAAVEDALRRDPKVANVNQSRFWNQCPHFPELSASSADFLIWHRAYLYYFENILRKASGDDRLCLPYWNYLEEGRRTFPTLYGSPQRAQPGGPPINPLYDARRENAFTAGVLELNPRAVNADAAFSMKNFFGAIAAEGFAGSVNPKELEPDFQGPIERNPHNLLHFAIGGFIGSDPQGGEGSSGLMGEVQTAAFDPIFWAHHCNIDRLWSVWDALDGREWGYSPGPEWFAAKPWWFNDADGSVRNNPRSHYLQPKNLAIDFDTDVPGQKRLSDALPVKDKRIALNLKAATSIVAAAEHPSKLAILGVGTKEITLTPKQSETVTIKISGERPFGQMTLQHALAEPPQGAERRAVLIVEGVDYTGAPSANYEVHLNPEGAGIPERKSESFVGSLALFGLKHGSAHHHQAHGSTQAFTLSKRAVESIREGKEVRVTFVPIPLLVQKDPRALVRAAGDGRPAEKVTVARIVISGIEAG